MKSKLPALMEEKGVDQKTVAAATGLSPTTVGKLYRSHFNRIDNHTVMTLCKYFGLQKLDELIEIVWEPEDETEAARMNELSEKISLASGTKTPLRSQKPISDSKVIRFPTWRVS